jgi:hypothetical protein
MPTFVTLFTGELEQKKAFSVLTDVNKNVQISARGEQNRNSGRVSISRLPTYVITENGGKKKRDERRRKGKKEGPSGKKLDKSQVVHYR